MIFDDQGSKRLTPKEAFMAMCVFIERNYERTQSDDLGALLGDLQLLSDGSTADPAAWLEWLDCLHAVVNK